jgi:hypothetical protein
MLSKAHKRLHNPTPKAMPSASYIASPQPCGSMKGDSMVPPSESPTKNGIPTFESPATIKSGGASLLGGRVDNALCISSELVVGGSRFGTLTRRDMIAQYVGFRRVGHPTGGDMLKPLPRCTPRAISVSGTAARLSQRTITFATCAKA